MNIEDYISKDLETLHPNDSILTAKNQFQEQRFSHLPVVENGKLYGSISESDVSTLDDLSKKTSDFNYLYDTFFANEEDTWVDLLNLFASNETNILPILDKNKEYIGYFDINDILKLFAETPFLNEEGIVLIIEKDHKLYSISEIAQITETHNGKLLGLFVSKNTETTTQITIKINTENVNDIIQSYRRYEYNVLSTHEDDSYLEELKNRSNYLQKYLNL